MLTRVGVGELCCGSGFACFPLPSDRERAVRRHGFAFSCC
jgi:hypothetical protein